MSVMSFSTTDFLSEVDQYSAHNYHPLPLVLTRGEGAWVWDVEGNEYIDFAAGIAVLNTGHRHPKIISAIEKQLHAFTHTAYQIVSYEGYVSLAERINARVPIDGPAKTAFFSTGAEAVENAVARADQPLLTALHRASAERLAER